MKNLTDDAMELIAAGDNPNSEVKFYAAIVPRAEIERLNALEKENAILKARVTELEKGLSESLRKQ